MTTRQAWTQRLTAMATAGNWPLRFLVLAGIAAFYALTAAGNLSEPDDAFAFAYRAERFPLTHVSDPRLLGYHTLARGLWLLSDVAGFGIRGLEILRGISVFCAAGCLWLVLRILTRNLGLGPIPALISTGLLASTYGFWRYAAEGDVYIPAMMLCAGILHLLLEHNGNPVRHTAIGALAGLCVLFYQPNAIPLFLAFPLLLMRSGLASVFAYCAAGGLVIVAGYLAGYLAFWPPPYGLRSFAEFLAQRSGEFSLAPLSLKTVLVSAIQSAFALGHDLLSSNWVFGLPHADRVVARIFSGQIIDEEVFLARQAGALVYLPLVVLPLAAVAAWHVLAAARPLALTPLRTRPMPVILLWGLLTALVIGRLNPVGIEPWIVFLLPLTLLVAVVFVAPACARQGARASGLLLLAVALHNAVGGMALVRDRASDLTYLRGEWVVNNGNAGDLAIVVANVNLAESLRYLSRARVEMIHPAMLPALADALQQKQDPKTQVLSIGRDFGGTEVHALARKTLANGGRVILFDDFFAQNRGLRSPAQWIRGVADLKSRCRAVHRSADGMVTCVLQDSGPQRRAQDGRR